MDAIASAAPALQMVVEAYVVDLTGWTEPDGWMSSWKTVLGRFRWDEFSK